MRASLIRTGSVPVQKPVVPAPGSPRLSLSRQTSIASYNNHLRSPMLSLHFHSTGGKDKPADGINRALPEGVELRSATENFGFYRNLSRSRTGSLPFGDAGFGSGGGANHSVTVTTGGNGGERTKIGAYYEEMLKSNPTDALLLRNYGKFLHEVEKNMARAEEFYERAILANPEDGELLSLYGKLIWETDRDEERAKSYFDQAIHAAPEDSTVLGSYAHFMWEAWEEEEVNGGGMSGKAEESAVELIAAF